ncbi:calcium-binding protein CAST [Tanacetum coccineum]
MMETNVNNSKTQLKSSSFRLRSPSLNSVRLRRIFDLFDTNHDELITVDELSRALILLGLDTNMNELDSMINTFIQPGNTGLTFDDFQALHKEIDDLFFRLDDNDDLGNQDDNNDEVNGDKQEEADLTEAFKVFDEDGDGYISATELQTVLVKLGFAEGNEIGRVERMISSVDRNHDGRVDFTEFKDMMRNVIVLKSQDGKRFGFVHFINVFNVERLVNNLCTIWVDHFKFHANIARFNRAYRNGNGSSNKKETEVYKSSYNGPREDVGTTDSKKSFVHVVKGINMAKETKSIPAIVLDDECLNSKDLSNSLIGRVKEFASLSNLKKALCNEGFDNLCVRYMGELWVLLEFDTTKAWKLKESHSNFGRVLRSKGSLQSGESYWMLMIMLR